MKKPTKNPKRISFHDFLVANGACEEAIRWVGKKSARRAWRSCRRYAWKSWLLCMLVENLRMHNYNGPIGAKCPGCRFIIDNKMKFPANELERLGVSAK